MRARFVNANRQMLNLNCFENSRASAQAHRRPCAHHASLARVAQGMAGGENRAGHDGRYGASPVCGPVCARGNGLRSRSRLEPLAAGADGGWDMCFDFTGNDRSALATILSRAKTRVGFEWVRRNRLRALAYNAWSPSKVREVHTAQHYLDLVAAVKPDIGGDLRPELMLAENVHPPAAPYALLHPGTARPEKYWLSERWGEIAAHLHVTYGLKTVFTCGPHEFERAHVKTIPHVEEPEKIRDPISRRSHFPRLARRRCPYRCQLRHWHGPPCVGLSRPANRSLRPDQSLSLAPDA